jgi:hypothetical protein
MSRLPQPSIETITPALAEQYLSNTIQNRRVNAGTVRKYQRDMALGRWHLTGEAIGFDRQGRLANGQHRLLACVAADEPFTSYVIRGLDDEAIRAMESGRGRTPGDAGTMMGMPNPMVRTAAAGMLIRIEHFKEDPEDEPTPGSHRRSTITTEDRLIYATEHAPEFEACEPIAREVYHALGVSQSAWLATAVLLARAGGAKAVEWLQQFASGAGLPTGDPRLALRAWVTNRLTKHIQLPSHMLIAVTISAWNATQAGSTRAYVRRWESKHDFPTPATAGA